MSYARRASPSGIAHPNYKTGRYSRYLPQGLLARYEDARADIDLTSLREELALLDTRIADVLSGLTTGASRNSWASARTAYAELVEAQESGKNKLIESAKQRLNQALSAERDEDSVWRELGDLFEQRRKLSETENKRLKDLQQMIPVERAMIFVQQLGESVKRHVSDPATLKAIQTEFNRITNAGVGGQS